MSKFENREEVMWENIKMPASLYLVLFTLFTRVCRKINRRIHR